MSSNLDQLGLGHLVHGTVTPHATTPTMTSNDASATLTRNGDGDYTVTFGHAFTSAPTVVLSPVQATFSTLTTYTVNKTAVSTTAFSFDCILNTTNGTVTALTDVPQVDFMVAGKRFK